MSWPVILIRHPESGFAGATLIGVRFSKAKENLLMEAKDLIELGVMDFV